MLQKRMRLRKIEKKSVKNHKNVDITPQKCKKLQKLMNIDENCEKMKKKELKWLFYASKT